MHRQKPLQQLSEVPLKQDQVLDIWDVFHKIPSIMVSHDMFVSMVLNCPPTVKMEKLKWEASDELRFLMQTYWMPFLQKVYTWFKCFGVCPWYWEKVRGTDHRIPVVPPFQSGHLTTYLDTKHRQQFSWYWKDTSDAAKNVNVEVSRHPPGLDGSIRSPIGSLLYEWRTMRIVRTSTEIATDQQAHQQHVFEFHPAKSNQGDDNLATLESFGDKIAGTVMARQEGLLSAKTTIRTADLHHSLATAAAANRGMRARFGSAGAVMRSEDQGDQWERENANVLERGIPLKPDFTYKPVPPPRISTNVVDISMRLEKMASAIMDIPFQLIESSGGRNTANVQGNLRFVNERIKDWTNVFETLVKKLFLLAYGETIQSGLDQLAKPHKMLELFADTELQVYMSCTPIASVADITAVHMAGYMKKRTAAEHTFNILGISHADLSISEYPDQVPQEMIKAAPKAKKRKTQEEVTGGDVSAV